MFTAHNADFDAAFIERAARREHVALRLDPRLCTLRLSRQLDPDRALSHRLGDICTRYGVSLDRPHDALQDALAAASVLPHLLAEHGVDSDESLAALYVAPVAGQDPGGRGAAELGVVGRFDDLGTITESHQHPLEPSVAGHREPGDHPTVGVRLTDVVDRVGLDHPPRRRRQTQRHPRHPPVEEPAPRLRQRFVGRLAELAGRLERLDPVDPERAQRLGAVVGGGDVPVAAVGEHLARGDHAFRRLVA